MLPKLYQAILMAVDAHAGQRDKSGQRYILHPARVAAAVREFGEDYEIVGWLHDVVEDTNITLEMIQSMFGPLIAEAVDSVTRREGEKYTDYILRAKKNFIGREVKIADLEDNSMPSRLEKLPESERGIVHRYNKARQVLEKETA